MIQSPKVSTWYNICKKERTCWKIKGISIINKNQKNERTKRYMNVISLKFEKWSTGLEDGHTSLHNYQSVKVESLRGPRKTGQGYTRP